MADKKKVKNRRDTHGVYERREARGKKHYDGAEWGGQSNGSHGNSSYGKSASGNGNRGKLDYGKSHSVNAGRGGSGYNKSGYGNSGYGNSAAAKSGRSNSGYGNSNRSDFGYGGTGRANSDYGYTGRNKSDYGNPAHGNSGYMKAGRGKTDYGKTAGNSYNRHGARYDAFEAEETHAELLVGRNPVIEALRAGRDIERIYMAEGAGGSITIIRALAKERGVSISMVDRFKLDHMAPGEKHQGVIAEVPAYHYSEMQDIFARAAAMDEEPFIVILDEITDPHNVGAIIRSAECMGAHGIIIPNRRACGLTSTVAKSAAGAIEQIPVVRVTNIGRTIEDLQARGIWIAACDMDGEPYYRANLNGAVAIVIGNEGRGIGKLVKEKCDFTVSIPMKGKINSLNASNAAAIVMAEIRRRREM